MAFNLNLPFKNRSADVPVVETPLTLPPKLGSGFTLDQQFRVLGVAFAVSMLLAVTAAYVQVQNSGKATIYAKVTSQLQPLAQQIPRAAQNAQRGEMRSFVELAEGRNRFNLLLERLANGGEVEGVSVPPTSVQSQLALGNLRNIWTAQDALVAQVLAQEKPLVALGRLVNEAVSRGPALTAAAEAAGGRLPYLTERILRTASQLALSSELDELAVLQLARDIATARELAPAGSALAKGLTALQEATAALPADIRPLAKAHAAGVKLEKGAKDLAPAVDDLVAAYQREFVTLEIVVAAAPFFGSLALGILVIMVLLYNSDAAHRREEAESQRRQAEAEKEVTQNAILRLLNEMSDLADGDLTVRTTVTEDITGAIADSVNFAIEELATLVRRLNDAAERVTHTTDQAQIISRELLAATETQANEIRQVSSSVLATADSMGAVSVSAQESAQVALASVDAAQRGASAVADSISGMNEIRGQIQETSKRIKRLGESSQEIGEIVELISDITEQTNVLALNAAIQAASAGEAGRGFSVVAEEVQRLAERSAGATKQIAALVKTIQTDTHDAVAAMEKSTQGVVEGTKRSDAAGQSLAEISSVSQDLAQRVMTIAGATQTQAKTATEVAVSMKSILEITDQTTAGTQQTARSVAELAALATELKGSVAGFKV
ncbi:MAG: methyl-accepting chemotaxis protein [Rhodocyclales bacterium]|nr:methyl-accepting chemotaxis protein [Rhodocyclales bacterium]